MLECYTRLTTKDSIDRFATCADELHGLALFLNLQTGGKGRSLNDAMQRAHIIRNLWDIPDTWKRHPNSGLRDIRGLNNEIEV